MFQSTPSGGKATPDYLDEFHPHYVSIHAFRGEGDAERRQAALIIDVSIHAFRGEGDPKARERRAR